MTAYEVYNLFLCIFVFIGFTAIFSVMLCMIVKNSLKTIKYGLEDEKIKNEYLKTQKSKAGGIIDTIVSILMCAIIFVAFGFSVGIGLMPDKVSGDIPTVRVVNSGSMASKFEENDYLFENNINDQIQTFDLILTYQLPKEEELKLYDIVVYEVDGILIMHRIVGIEEPCYDHPNQRWFLLQGDAVANPDRFPVKYSQMKAIYRGERIPFIGSFVAFMQSPAGWLCIFLVILAVIITPILEKKLNKTAKDRLLEIGYIDNSGSVVVTATPAPVYYVNSADNENETDNEFAQLKGKVNTKSFNEKLDELPFEDTCWYIDIINYIDNYKLLTVSENGKTKSYKYKNKSLIKVLVKGKTVNLYLALNPSEYENSKYKFIDASTVKKYSSTPMRIKLSSSRQVKYAKELIDKLLTSINKGD